MPRPARVARNAVERKVYFFRANVGFDEAGDFLPFDPAPILGAINRLTFQSGARYLDTDGDDAICCWIDGPKTLRIANVRRSGLPQVDSRGTLTPLSIPASSGLVEETHVVFFAHNVVGMLFNFHGPRLSRLAEYFKKKASAQCRSIKFDALIRENVLTELSRLRDIRMFQFKLHSSWAGQLHSANQNLASAIETMIDAGDAGEIEIVLRPKSYSGETLNSRLLALARRILNVEGVESGASQLRVRGVNGDTGNISEIDLLSDQLISKKRVVLADERSRALKRRSAYDAIEEAFQELGQEVSAATSISS